MSSLRGLLLAWLLALLTVVAVCAGVLAYWLDREEVGELLDMQLRQIAWNVGDRPELVGAREVAGLSIDPEDEYIVSVWDAEGLSYTSNSSVALPKPTTEGFENFDAKNEAWRAYAFASVGRTVQVAQRMVVRQELATNSALRAVLPIGALVPLSWLLVGWVVNRVLKPLDRLTEGLRAWHNGAREPLSLRHLPDEVLPLAVATNDLIGKLQAQIEFRRAFISDAAHELRTPLTALRLQARNLRSEAADPGQLELIREIDRGMLRMSGMVSQMLKLARADDIAAARDPRPVALAEAVTASIQAMLPLAADKRVEVGASSVLDGVVTADADDLRTLLDNIIENAIRYTPPGGAVDVSVSRAGDRPILHVRDTGPGISEHLLDRVFDRFFRVAGTGSEGSGLGLAIVRAIADRFGASVTLENQPDRGGLIVSVAFAASTPVRIAEPVARTARPPRPWGAAATDNSRQARRSAHPPSLD